MPPTVTRPSQPPGHPGSPFSRSRDLAPPRLARRRCCPTSRPGGPPPTSPPSPPCSSTSASPQPAPSPPAAAGRHRGEVGGGCAKGPESMGRPHSCVAAVVCCRQRQTTALQAVRLRAALRARPSLPYIVFLCRRRSCSQRSRKGKCSAMAGGLFRCHHRLVIFSSFLHNSKLQL